MTDWLRSLLAHPATWQDRSTAAPDNRTPSSILPPRLMQTPEAFVPQPGQPDIVTRLKKNREPIRGNYCPEGSQKPSIACQ